MKRFNVPATARASFASTTRKRKADALAEQWKSDEVFIKEDLWSLIFGFERDAKSKTKI
jgi:hypothetical protein